MRIFVASWFFPPLTTSEASVAWKLLSHSHHEYDVCSSLSEQWTYKHDSPVTAPNITTFPVMTDDLDEWVEKATALFFERHAAQPYDAIMTRTMPPESVLVARKIRAKFPDIPWIASLADPIAKNPYEVQDIVLDSATLSAIDKWTVMSTLRGENSVKNHPHPGVAHLYRMKQIEDYALAYADVVVFPCNAMRAYVLGTKRRPGTIIVPHSYDFTSVAKRKVDDTGQVTLTFVGYSDAKRSLMPLVEAVALLSQQDPDAISRLRVRLIGGIPEDIRTAVFNRMLQNVITIEPGVDYRTSLEIAQQSDWLIHVDAYFESLSTTGGSIFLAAKIADYMGTNNPILAITGKGSPADEVVRHAGGLSFEPTQIADIAAGLASIADGSAEVTINRGYRDQFDAPRVAERFDRAFERVLGLRRFVFDRSWWPDPPETGHDGKLVTVCVPAYKVEPYLDRCLFSLASSPSAGDMEILVVNDDSPDHSRNIALKYQEHYPDIVKLIDKPNGGHGSTINTALGQARGTYFRVVDGDDWVDSLAFAKLLDKLKAMDELPDLVSSDYYQVYINDGHTVEWCKCGPEPYDEIIDFASADLSMEYFTMAAAMFKTELLLAADFQLQEHTFYVDVEYLLYPIPWVKTVMFSKEHVYRYAVGNPDQSINERTFVNRYEDHDRVIRRMLKYMADSDMNGGQKSYIDSLFSRHLLRSHYLLSLLWDTDKARGARRARDFDAYLASVDKSLYDAVGARYVAVRQARSAGFSLAMEKRLKSMERGTRGDPLYRRARHLVGIGVRLVARTHVAQAFIATSTGQRLKARAKYLATL